MSTPSKENFEKEIFIDAACENVNPQESEVTSKIISDSATLGDNTSFLFENPRQELPGRVPTQSFRIWATLKELVGRDITHISMPVSLNEPLSTLHKFMEGFSHKSLLESVLNAIDPVERLEFLGANFAVCQSSMSYRSYKPFNPLLGETYEVVVDRNSCYFIAEQVSHHPPISAFHFRYPRVVSHGCIEQSIKFWGNSADILLDGPFTFEFFDTKGEIESVITLNMPVCSARNIILGEHQFYLYFSVMQ